MATGLDATNYRANIYIRFPLLKKIGLDVLLYPFVLTSQMKYHTALTNIVLARRAEGKDAKRDLYSSVADIKDPETGEEMRLKEIWSEAAFLIPAGMSHPKQRSETLELELSANNRQEETQPQQH